MNRECVVVVKNFWLIIGSILSFIALILGLYFIEESYTEVIVHGGINYEATIYEEYRDLGFDLYHNNELINKKEYTYNILGDVDTNKLGKYKVIYDIKYHLRSFHIERTVNVVDNVKPVITVNMEKLERDYCTRKDKKALVYSANDNYDGEIKEIFKEEIDNNIILSATDNSGNKEVLYIPIDYGEKPVNQIKLTGGDTVYVLLNKSYKEQGAGYFDGCGVKLDGEVKIEGSVNTSKTGTYEINYSIDDIKKVRKVVVYKENQSVVTGNGNGKILYFTFDDGPGPYTTKILNTLDKYNVKATFFVTNQFPGYVHLIKDEYEKGHAVAVHSYTHNYNIYRSVDAYVNDFNKMNNVIENYTGTKSRIFRFPGGSSNTVSRSYSKGVVTKIANKMTSDGYVYFDWDITSGDASGAGSSKIYSNVINGAKSCSRCVILMHDIKLTTANALDDILKTLSSNGYRFGTLSTTSPTMHHTIAN